MKVIIKIALITLLSSLYAQALSIEETFRSAVGNDKKIKSELQKRSALKNEIGIEKSGYLPSLNVAATLGREHTATPGNLLQDKYLNSYNVALEGKVNVFSGFQTYNKIREKELLYNRSYFTVRKRVSEVVNNMAKIYLKLLEYKTRLDIVDQKVTLLEEYISKLTKQIELGTGSEADFYEVKARLNATKTERLSFQKEFLNAVTEYKKVIGKTPIIKALKFPKIDKDIFNNISTAIEKIDSKNDQILIAKKDIIIAQVQKQQTLGKYSPQIDLLAIKTLSDNVHGVEAKDNSEKIFLQLNYNLYNGDRENFESKAKIHTISSKKEDLEVVRENILEKIKSLFHNYMIFTEQLTYIQEQKTNLNKTKVYYRNEFDLSRRTIVDLLNIDLEINQATLNYQLTLLGQVKVFFELITITGEFGNYLDMKTIIR